MQLRSLFLNAINNTFSASTEQNKIKRNLSPTFSEFTLFYHTEEHKLLLLSVTGVLGIKK